MDLELLNVNPNIFQVFILPLSNPDFIGGFIDTHIPEVILKLRLPLVDHTNVAWGNGTTPLVI